MYYWHYKRKVIMPVRRGVARAPRRVLQGRGSYANKIALPRRRVLRGRGDFFSDAWNWTKGAVKSVGSLVKDIGGVAADVRKIKGKGDYSMPFAAGPSARPMKSRSQKIDMGHPVPEFASKGHYTEVCHTEYIQDISSATSFTNTAFNINPGLPSTFPWLSQLAQNFEEYRFEQLIFYFRSTSANALNSTNTALGVVIGATNYNATQAAFTTKSQMENYQFAKSASPSIDQIFPIECDVRENVLQHLYIRSGSIPTNTDLRLYDLGLFQCAGVGSQASAVVGELWCSYKIRLYKPSLSVLDSPIVSCHYGRTAWTTTQLSQIASSTPFGTSAISTTSYEVGSNLACSFSTTDGKVTLPATLGSGTFFVQYTIIGSATTITTGMTISATTNCSALNLFNNGSSSNLHTTNGSTLSTVSWTAAFIQVTGPSAVITLSNNSTIPSAVSAADFFVMPINPNILTGGNPSTSIVRFAADARYNKETGKYVDEKVDDVRSAKESVSERERDKLLAALAEMLLSGRRVSEEPEDSDMVVLRSPARSDGLEVKESKMTSNGQQQLQRIGTMRRTV